MTEFNISDIVVTNHNVVIQLANGWERDFKVVRHATLDEKQKFYQDRIAKDQYKLEQLTNFYPRLSRGDEYLFVTNDCVIHREPEINSERDRIRYELGNYFHLNDLKVAKQEAAHHKFEKQVAMFIKQREGKTLYPEEGILNFTFVILPFDNKVFATNSLLPRCRGWLASTEETILDAIKHFGSDKFIKWQLGKL